MIRPLDKTTILPFLFSRELPPNQAPARDTLGGRSLSVPGVLIEHWIPITGKRHTWIFEDGSRINGLVSAKGSTKPAAWQVDYLQVDNEDMCVELLEGVSVAAAEMGVRKLLLRLDAASPLMDAARQNSFVGYTKEHTYHYAGQPPREPMTAPEPYHLRSKHDSDEHNVFELYNSATPQPVRMAEGLTLEEWQGSRGQGVWMQQRKEFVLQKEGRLVGWLKVNATSRRGCFEIMYSRIEQDTIGWLIDYAIGCLPGRSIISCTAFAYQVEFKNLLENSKFEQMGEYDSLVKDIAIRVRETQFVPMRAQVP
jgi:hypothetical protein